MTTVVSIGLFLSVWGVLAGIGVYRGLQGAVIIFSSWADVALSVAIVFCLVAIVTVLWLKMICPQIAFALAGTVLTPWLYATSKTNRHALDLLVTAPAKMSLIGLAMLFSFLALESAAKALSPKTENRDRLINGAMAAATGAAAWGVFRTIQRLVAEGENQKHRLDASPPASGRRIWQ